MPISVVNSEAQSTGFGTSVTLTLGFSPTAGNALLVAVQTGAQEVTGVADSNSDAFTEDFDSNADGLRTFWRLQSLGSGVTSITITIAASTTPWVYIWEVSGLSATPLDHTRAWAATPDGFVVSHTVPYTTDSADELIIGTAQSGTNRAWTGTGGTTAITHSANVNRAGFSKIAGASGAGNLNWDYDTATSGTAALVTYRAAAGGGGLSIPIAMRYYDQMRNR